MNDKIEKIKDGVEIVGAIMKAAGDNPDVKAAGQNLAQTALTVTKAINNVLLPIAAINFAFDKAKKYFSERFAKDLTEKTASIPSDMVVEPKASIAGPVLQGLAFTHEEENLKSMYLSLLASSMDKRVAREAHPAFVEIIKQLDSEEAALLQSLLRTPSAIAIVEIKEKAVGESGFIVIFSHLLNLHDKTSKNPVENQRITAMVDNWIRLGLIEVDYNRHLTDEKAYDWVEKRPEYIRLSEQVKEKAKGIDYQKGIVKRTAFGLQFAQACGVV
jgi:hypothetical protein